MQHAMHLTNTPIACSALHTHARTSQALLSSDNTLLVEIFRLCKFPFLWRNEIAEGLRRLFLVEIPSLNTLNVLPCWLAFVPFP